MRVGSVQIDVSEHGGIACIQNNETTVTSNRTHAERLVPIHKLDKQRGGSPLHGIFMPRANQRLIAQPGKEPIHGSTSSARAIEFLADESNHSLSWIVPSEGWKAQMYDYYLSAFAKNDNTIEFDSLRKLAQGNINRYTEGTIEHEEALGLMQSLNARKRRVGQKLALQIGANIEAAYPGQLDLIREIAVDYESFGARIPVIKDTVRIVNMSQDTKGIHAAGYHTYFAASILHEVVNNSDSTKIPSLHIGYDENLADVRVRVVNKPSELWFIYPTYSFQNSDINQIIYHDDKFDPKGLKEVAIENTTQQGGIYPEEGRILKPREEDKIGFDILILPKNCNAHEFAQVQGYINSINSALGGGSVEIEKWMN